MFVRRTIPGWRLSVLLILVLAGTAYADVPTTSYIFPAGAQRGTTVKVRVGGLYLHEGCPLEFLGPGITAPTRLERMKTIWFEGPLVPLPASQQAEDYPQDMGATLTVAQDAELGARAWRVWTAQGAVPARPFLVGDLPEIIEDEIDGEPLPVGITLPVTINGRIFPREDVDVWKFAAKAGQTITCTARAGSLGSPLEARLEVRARGQRLTESEPLAAGDAHVRFVAPADGDYEVRIHDLNFGGLQSYVYRLTVTSGPQVDRVFPLGGRRGSTASFVGHSDAVTVLADGTSQKSPSAIPFEVALPAEGRNEFIHRMKVDGADSNAFRLDLDDLPEFLETEGAETAPVETPAVFNGRIDRPGDTDTWKFRAAKGTALEAEVRAARLGSPLDSLLIVRDAEGKELARNEDLAGGMADSLLRVTIPADGVYDLQIQDQLDSRGGPDFAYRIRLTTATPPGFQLHLTSDAIAVARGGEFKLKLHAERFGGFAAPIAVEVTGLPTGISMPKAEFAMGQTDIDLTFKAEATAKVDAGRLTVKGTAMVGDTPITRVATMRIPTGPGVPANQLLPPECTAVVDTLLLAVTVPTPYKAKGVYEVKYAQRGGLFTRHYRLERNGFAGSLQVSLADKQMRHLQGVTGPTITIPADAEEFDYTVYLPPWMEIGRTSRSLVKIVGEVVDPDGSRHTVSFTSANQNEQIVALVDPGQLSIDVERQSVRVLPGTAQIPFRIGRGVGLNVPVKIELVIPGHIRGVTASAVTLPPDQSTGSLSLTFNEGDRGPFNAPLLLRATALREQSPVVAETNLQAVEVP